MKKIYGIIPKKLVNSFQIGHYFGFKFGILDFFDSVIFKHRGRIGKKFEHYRYEKVKQYLKKRYMKIDILENQMKQLKKESKILMQSYIWIFWWQGISEDTPDIVKQVIKSIERYKGNHEIVILNKENISKYIQIPQFVYEKLKSGIISIPHFADIIRTKLLYEYGGIWMDATLYMTDTFSNDIYNNYFYTINHTQRADYHVCKGKWSTFFLASAKGNPFFLYLTDMQLKYWKYENKAICYLIIDCFIALAYENNASVKNMIDSVPINHVNVFEMQKESNSLYTREKYIGLCKNGYLHKLTYKRKNDNSEQTIYNYILNN
ncbi:MAG: capsular polysaccharide synthesis protein [Anaerostipes hadrus]|jgi:hypothetical protein|uniref:capsular polysaccharide synthesis protein n=1 Tax=Anaerostipes hadrus TaxID=649756 RepID=UPI0022DF8417|nr:capsular polysaccharide synthesis protein [Anaerostipes hadrus]UYI93418.1 MAG: capsular polysaccharide synthesis protein [Anaerostipes hadrus]